MPARHRAATLVDIEMEADSDLDEFEENNQQTKMIEHQRNHGDYYGTGDQKEAKSNSLSEKNSASPAKTPGSGAAGAYPAPKRKGKHRESVQNITSTFFDQSQFSYFASLDEDGGP